MVNINPIYIGTHKIQIQILNVPWISTWWWYEWLQCRHCGDINDFWYVKHVQLYNHVYKMTFDMQSDLHLNCQQRRLHEQNQYCGGSGNDALIFANINIITTIIVIINLIVHSLLWSIGYSEIVGSNGGVLWRRFFYIMLNWISIFELWPAWLKCG